MTRLRPFIALDWGTSSLRGARLDDHARVVEERSFPRGILTVPQGGFRTAFDECFGDWMSAAPDTLCLISGMAGSRQGWAEAPYCASPAGFAEASARMHWIEPGRIGLVPGISHMSPRDGTPDVMRGEETQIFGAIHLLGRTGGVFVLPGTHSKWAIVEDGRILSFRTFMTGEFFALLSTHSILARTLHANAPFDETAFLDGVMHSQNSAGLLHNAFSARTLALFGRMESDALTSYLSGLVIGEELRSQPLLSGIPVVLIGSAQLTARYAMAMTRLGCHVVAPESNATWAGLHALRMQVEAQTETRP
ncbi:2-dehydro-3-deoxygalactonokinase [Variovorax sp. VNK109]|jgi:2-dehydro-3-deoxygalactonokinase|uniref:2-dehydro-3-deoxygalactonokinase n=1 Tax=Variovorax sp. VNK109 TaxID=3400919 RepID=UPI003BFDB339